MVKLTAQSNNSDTPIDDRPSSSADRDAHSDNGTSEDLTKVVEQEIVSMLMKLENIFYVTSKAIDELSMNYTPC